MRDVLAWREAQPFGVSFTRAHASLSKTARFKSQDTHGHHAKHRLWRWEAITLPRLEAEERVFQGSWALPILCFLQMSLSAVGRVSSLYPFFFFFCSSHLQHAAAQLCLLLDLFLQTTQHQAILHQAYTSSIPRQPSIRVQT